MALQLNKAICVFCASSTDIDDKFFTLASEVGAAIAQRGYQLVTGGGTISMMGAVATAARKFGGKTIGVIPEGLLEFEVADEAADELIITKDMRTRKAEMDLRSDAFIALPGGIGTLEELIEVWTARSLAMHNKPIIILDPWDDYLPLKKLISELTQKQFIRQAATIIPIWTTTIAQALNAIEDEWLAPRDIVASASDLLEAEVDEINES
jgi:uncharacterized protein (TIGR00730 family)